MLAMILAASLTNQIELGQPTGNEKIVAGRVRVIHEDVPVVRMRHRHRLIREQVRMIEVEVPTTQTVMVPQQQTVMVRKWVAAPTVPPTPPPITDRPPADRPPPIDRPPPVPAPAPAPPQ